MSALTKLKSVTRLRLLALYEAGKRVYISISSQLLHEGDDIKGLDVFFRQSTRSGAVGDPDESKIDYTFRMPDRLDRGDDAPEYVHGVNYYVYVTYFDGTIVAVTKFTVIGDEIEINPEEGQVGTEVEISGLKILFINLSPIRLPCDPFPFLKMHRLKAKR